MPTTDTVGEAGRMEHLARRARLGFMPAPETRVRRSLVGRVPTPIAASSVVVVPPDRPAADYAPFNFMAMPGWKCIVKLVSLKESVPFDAIVSPSRSTGVVHARMVSMALIHEHCRMSLPQVGRCFHRDHTTVLHAIRTVKQGFPAKRWSNQHAH